ncbi:hypothetical protein BJ741DRAFT_139149 [Chytriomyces cf. hyalinus JEL632]|nr:hypothetical protein BJ741DRAFT_139149 [Chytriomyces cf. hyalinus JEL632]
MSVSNQREHANRSADQLSKPRPPVPKQSSGGQQAESFSINSAWNRAHQGAHLLQPPEHQPSDSTPVGCGVASSESGALLRSILMDSDRQVDIDGKPMKRGIADEEWAANKRSAVPQNLPAADAQSSHVHRGALRSPKCYMDSAVLLRHLTGGSAFFVRILWLESIEGLQQQSITV